MDGFLLDSARLAIEQERGIWANRVPTDYFDRLTEQRPESVAMIEYRNDTGNVSVLASIAETLFRFSYPTGGNSWRFTWPVSGSARFVIL